MVGADFRQVPGAEAKFAYPTVLDLLTPIRWGADSLGNSQIRGSMIQHGNWRKLPWASRLGFERILQRLKCAGWRGGLDSYELTYSKPQRFCCSEQRNGLPSRPGA
jgi:hypothetical protein